MMTARLIGSLIIVFSVGNAGIVGLNEYLNTSYESEMEYVDGALEERHVGEWLHSTVQMNAAFHLRSKYPIIKVFLTLRSSVTPPRIRVPDVSVTLTAPGTDILWEAAFLVVEVLSEDDRITKVIERLEDFAAKGVPHIWLFDPRLKKMSVYR